MAELLICCQSTVFRDQMGHPVEENGNCYGHREFTLLIVLWHLPCSMNDPSDSFMPRNVGFLRRPFVE